MAQAAPKVALALPLTVPFHRLRMRGAVLHPITEVIATPFPALSRQTWRYSGSAINFCLRLSPRRRCWQAGWEHTACSGWNREGWNSWPQ